MGEDVSDMATTTSQLQAKLLALTGGQVDIMLDENTFKSSTQILREMAAAWEDMTDIQRAYALELMGGKRQANVLSALISNFDTAEKAIDASAKSAGSALRENEVYLDSIQGRIDLLTNATQTMWSNALDSDVVKFFVDLLTKFVKLIDKVGLLGTALGGLFIYLTAFKKQNPFSWIKSLTQYLSGFKGWKGFGQLLGQLTGVLPVMKAMTAETIANTIATTTNDNAKTKEIMTTMGLTSSTQMLTQAEREAAISKLIASQSTHQLTNEQIMAMAAQWGVKVSYDATTGSLKVLDATTKSFMASNPIGWILAIISVLVTVISLLSQIPSKMERLEEKLDNLNSEISDLESEIDSLNSELETTQDRMAELLAMDALSFTEQEELKNLQLQNAELERQIELQEILLKSKEKDRADTAKEWIDNAWNGEGSDQKYWVSGNGTIGEDKWWTPGVSGKEALETSLPIYEGLKKHYDELEAVYASARKELEEDGKLTRETFEQVIKLNPNKSVKDIEKFYNMSWRASDESLVEDFKSYSDNINENVGNMKGGIEMVLGDMSKIISENELSYSMGDEDVNKFLDEYFAYQYAYQEAQGISAKSSAIVSIFDDTSSESIKKLKEDLSEIASDDTLDASQKQTKALELVNKAIDSNDEGYQRLKTSMDIVGISADEVARYFVQLSEAPDSSTVEGITAQYQKGIDALSKYKGAATDIIAEFTNLDGDVEQITWGSLFDDEGEAIDTQISKVLQGADETARTEFARIAEAINEGEMTVENAMKSFSISGVQAGYQLLESSVVEINGDVFKDIADDISGLIDTFDEFGSALESVANAIDLVNQAQAEMAYSGHVSVETALDLINSTDNWNEVLTVENGNIQLVDGAMNILAQSKLNQIKTNLQLALSEAQAGLEQARLAQNSDEVAKTLEESTTESVRQLAANMTYLSTLIGEFLDGNFFGAHSAAKSAKADSLKATEYQKTSTTSSMSVADWEEKVANIESKLSILESVDTTEEFENNYSSDDVSGGTNTKKEAEDKTVEDGWGKLINKYENELALITNERDLIQAEIDQMEAQGGKASAQYYEDLIRNSNDEKTLLEQKKAALEEYLAANAGAIDPDTWTEYNNEINETAVAIKECETNTIEWVEALREIDMHYFEQATDEISRLGEELDFVNSLLEDEEVADENGNWSSAALTRLGLYTQQMEMAAVEAQRYQEEIDKLNVQYKNGELSEEQYQERLSELVSGQQDAIQSYEDAKDGIVELNEARIDAIKDGIDKEIEAYEDLIDLKKEELDAERDLYDFRKNVKKQTKDIASLERRIAALSGSTAASDIAERRKLEAELREAREGLNDTYYERSKDQQSQALDDEAEAFSESKEKYIEQLEQQLKDTEALIQQSLMDVLLNADTIYEQLAGEEGIAAKYGVQLSDKLTQPWKDASAQAISWKNELQNSMTAGDYAALIGEGGAITAFVNGVATKMQGSWNTAQNAVKSYADFLTGAELGNKFSNTITGFGAQIQTIIDKWNGVKKAADDAYTAQTRQVTVGGNPNAGNDNTGGKDQNGGDGGKIQDKSSSLVTALQKIINQFFGGALKEDGKMGPLTKAAIKIMQGVIGAKKTGEYDKTTYEALKKWLNARPVGSWFKEKGISIPVPMYAKGTLGTSRDEWAITDEIGDELVLVPGANGNLSFMRKGTSVVPADITANLVEWGKLNPDMLKVGGGANINMISNAVTKPELNFEFDSLVHVDNCSQETLKDLEKMVDNKINQFSKQMNYAIKRIGGR